jgi:hypothetical protein
MVVVELMIQVNSIDLWMKKMTHHMNSLMPLMFDVMCDLLVMMCGAWQCDEVMWREELMFRSLTERMEVNKKVSF